MQRFLLLGTALAVAACTAAPPVENGDPSGTDSVEEVAMDILQALEDRDMEALASFVDPDGTVRFSPYTYVQTLQDVALTPEELPELTKSDEVLTWGSFAGSGEPIEMTFSDYLDRFVYEHDYAEAPDVTWNENRVNYGSTIDNIADVYPDAQIVQYHFPGFDPQYGGLDWRSLSLVLEDRNGTWTLVGIVHSEWTP